VLPIIWINPWGEEDKVTSMARLRLWLRRSIRRLSGGHPCSPWARRRREVFEQCWITMQGIWQRRMRYIPSILLAVVAFMLLHTALSKSLAYDEIIYPAAGVLYWKTNDLRWNQEHPPLQKYISALPLLSLNLKIPADMNPTNTDAWRAGYRLFYNQKVSGHTLTVLARIPTILITLFFLIFLFRWTHKKWGKGPAVWTTAAVGFDPLVLGNGALALNDLYVTAFFVTAILLFIDFMDGDLKYGILSGFFAGLAITSKYTGFLLIPLFLGYGLWNVRQKRIRLTQLFVPFGMMALVILLVYKFNINYLIESLKAGLAVRESAESMGFLLGPIPKYGTWYYYPIALFLKTPVPLMLLWIFSCRTLLLSRKKESKKNRYDNSFLMASIGLILLAAMGSQNHFGLRYLLPGTCLMALFIGMAYPQVREKKLDFKIFTGLFAWLILETLFIHPNHMVYFNQLVGGPRHGYKWLDGSNQDWGQDLVALASFMKKQENSSLYLSYVGSGRPEAYGIEYQDVFSPAITSAFHQPKVNPVDVDREYFAISARLRIDPKLQGLFNWIEDRKPHVFLGYTLFVFDVTKDYDALMNIAKIYEEMGRLQWAARQYVRILHVNPGYYPARKAQNKLNETIESSK